MDEFEYIAKTYGKRFKKGQRVEAFGKQGVVTGASHYVFIKLDTLKHSNPYHPDDVKAVEETA